MSLRPGRTDCDSGCTKLERVHQFGHKDHAFVYTKSKHWHPISGFQKLISNLANKIQASASKLGFENAFKCKSDARTAEEICFRHH